MQRNLFYIVFLTIFLTLGNAKTYSQEVPQRTKSFSPKNQTDTLTGTKKEVATTELTEIKIKP